MTREERKERRRKIAARVAKGLSLEEVAAEFGMTTVTVLAAARENGLLKREKKTKRIDQFRVLKRLMEGAGLTEIGREFGVVPQSIQRIRDHAEAAGFDLPHYARGRRRRGRMIG